MYPSRIRLSTSARDLFLECERKFQLIELLQGNETDNSKPIFSFGHAWGEGVVEYLATGDINAALYRAWLYYWPHLEDATSMRLEELVFFLLLKDKHKLDAIREEWEIAEFNGKPARELGFRLDINDRFYLESAIDAVLKHKKDNHYAVLENKHTMSYLSDITPMYKNSGQALGYSIIVDEIAKQPYGHYHLHYLVGQFKKDIRESEIHFFPWKKSLLDRLNWFFTLGIDVRRIQELLDINLFPIRGGSCLKYNRPCHFFGLCTLRAHDVPKDDAYMEAHKSAHVKEIEASVQFRFKLDDIIAEHLRRIREEM